jgi:hypothetical protein
MIDTIGWPVMIGNVPLPVFAGLVRSEGRLKVLRGHRSVCQKENDYGRES